MRHPVAVIICRTGYFSLVQVISALINADT